jgi:uncharacterized protein
MITSSDVMQGSPLDVENQPQSTNTDVAGTDDNTFWKPSYYNFFSSSTDGHLVVWNTRTRAISAFPNRSKGTIEGYLKGGEFTAPNAGIVKYLFERGFLVPQPVNEFRRVQMAFGADQYRTDALELILLSSEDCNFRCKYCYERFARGTMQPRVRAAIRRLVETRAPQLKEFNVKWFGGEPLYGMAAIAELAPFFKQVIEEHGLKSRFHMTTNGYLLDEATATRLLGWGIDDFQITLDGLGDEHDRHRPARDGAGTYDKIYDNLLKLRDRPEPFTVVIRVNFDQENSGGLNAFLDVIARDFKDDARFQMAFLPVLRHGGQNDAELAVCGAEERRSVSLDAQREARRRGIHLATSFQSSIGPGSNVCYAARPFSYIIGASGLVMKCTVALDNQDYNIVGKILDDGALELDEDKMARWTEPAFEQDSGCRSCVIMPTCHGMHCPMIRFEHGQRPCPPVKHTAKREMVEALSLSAMPDDDERPAGGH